MDTDVTMDDQDQAATADTNNQTTAAAMPPQPTTSQQQHEDEPLEEASPPDPASRLNQLEAFLRQPDAVMEPNILERLGEYVGCKGNPRHAVEYLTENYVGYAQMASLVCGWLKVADTIIAPPTNKRQKQQKQRHNGGSQNNELYASSSQQQHQQQPPSSQQPPTTAAAALNEEHYLREFVKERFDPNKFSGIFLPGGGGIPKWLNPLIVDADGRSLIYDLSSTYSNCLLLNFAIQKILMQPGREAEVAAVGTSLVGYFGVFHRLMAAKLREIAAATTEQQLATLSADFVQVCAQSQHAYVHAQLLLQHMAGMHENAVRFKRLSQELEAAAAASQGSVVYKIRRWLLSNDNNTTSGNNNDATAAAAAMHIDNNNGTTTSMNNDNDAAIDVVAIASGVLADMLASATTAGGAAPTPDVIKLHKLYFPTTSTTNNSEEEVWPIPPSSLLRHPGVFHAFLCGLFNPGRPLVGDVLTAHIDLLALAAAAQDNYTTSNTTTPTNDDDNSGGDGSSSMVVEKVKDEESKRKSSSWSSQPCVTDTIHALQLTVEVAHKAAKDTPIPLTTLKQAEDAMEHPVCAAGIIRTVQVQLSGTEAWATSLRASQKPSPLIGFLGVIAGKHPSLQEEVLQLLKVALSSSSEGGGSSTGHSVSLAILDVAAALVVSGYILPTLIWAERWSQTADPILVRHLFFSILERTGTPYSPFFAKNMLRLLTHAGFKRVRLGSRDWSARLPLLAEFTSECSRVVRDSSDSERGGNSGWELSAAESGLLKELESAEQLKNIGSGS